MIVNEDTFSNPTSFQQLIHTFLYFNVEKYPVYLLLPLT